jgi:hypothetical protein
MTTRRGFLKALGIGLAAPAIVRAESLMKLVVPKQEIILLNPICFGNMKWRPELTLITPMSRLHRQEVNVQPAFQHINSLPQLDAFIHTSNQRIILPTTAAKSRSYDQPVDLDWLFKAMGEQ